MKTTRTIPSLERCTARGALVVAGVLAGVLALALVAPATARAACDPTPRRASCTWPSDARDLIDIQVGPLATKNRVLWKIPKLGATSAEDLPDPGTTDYAVCFYVLDQFEEFFLGYEAIAPAGLGCGRPRCWTRNASGGVGFAGGSQRPDGIVSLRVRPGADGKAQLSFIGRGPNLAVTDPLQIAGGELIVELQAGASCWSALYLNTGEPPALRTNQRYRKKGSTPLF